MKPELARFFETVRTSIDVTLNNWEGRIVTTFGKPAGRAMLYALRSGGKRFRPALLLAAWRESGGSAGREPLALAAAIETIHTYSLVHDDLPCMDDDELRRGKPTTHARYGVPMAMEAAFRMVELAGMMIVEGCTGSEIPEPGALRVTAELFHAAGASGMVGGQCLDLDAEGREPDADGLERMHRMKTGALITAATVIGGIAAEASDSKIEALRSYGDHIGLAFQIVDDLLDATATSQELGKTAGKDVNQEKATFVTILGVEESMRVARAHIGEAVDALRRAGLDSMLLEDIAQFILDRRS